MKHTTLFCLMVAAAVITGNAEAIYKCTTAKGVVYQDRPCRDGTETDVQIVIPSGELAPAASSADDDAPRANAPRVESRFGAPKRARTPADTPVTLAKPTDRKNGVAATDDTRKKEARSADNASVPMTAEQARRTEPTAKYYTTDVTSSDSDTPEHMTCESPSGEKRRFILTNGKLSSI